MERYSLNEFITLIENADIVYATVELNAAIRSKGRLRRKQLLESLKKVDPHSAQASIGFYGWTKTNKNGDVIVNLG